MMTNADEITPLVTPVMRNADEMIETRNRYDQESRRILTSGVDGTIKLWAARSGHPQERDFFIDNLLVRIHFIIVMIRWTGLATWEFEFPARRGGHLLLLYYSRA